MTNLALFVLSITLAAGPSEETTAITEVTSAAVAPAVPAPEAATSSPAPASANEEVEEVVSVQETDPAASWYGSGFPEHERILALPTARTTRPGSWNFIIDHRAKSAIYNDSLAHTFRDFAGFDTGLTIGLGVRYGIVQGLDVGIYRVGGFFLDTYEFDGRYSLLRQETSGVDVAVRGGLTWFAQANQKDATWPFGQILASRVVANRLLLSAGALYHSNSTNGTKYNEDKKWSLAVAGGAEFRLAAAVALDAEVVSCTSGYCSKNPAFSAGVKMFTNRHTFALVCGNTQYLTADGYVTNTDTPWKKLVIGFNITREY